MAAENDISIEFISTGTVKIRPSMLSQPAQGFAILRQVRALLDSSWSDSLPVGVFLIRHPEGLYLMDCDQSPCCNDPGYAPRIDLFSSRLSQFAITSEDGIVAQLKRRGIRAKDLKAVLLTHLHADHTGGLEELLQEAPTLPVYISNEHWSAFGKHPLRASMLGATPNHWPKPFNPTVIDFTGDALGPWPGSYAVTNDKRLLLVDSSGHVPGHMSLVIRGATSEDGEQGVMFFLPGDATYALHALDKEEPDGINDDPQRALETLKKIKEFARSNNVVVVPSHDPNAATILANRSIYRPQ